ncbi:MAG TPA: MobQ family relaxase [Steroidobacteraceae bacterium]|nr:MobQ family relaxase [Steroidobacteraceae bacterium]
MAIFYVKFNPVSRSSGRTATAAAAYRSGESIRDERTGVLYNHSNRDDVLHKDIFLPSRFDQADAGMDWARDRSILWNTAEKAEQRSNSRVAREYLLALPAELSAEQRVTLARAYSREIADRYNVAVDLAIHAPRPEGDQRNFHAHLLATTREVTPQGLGPQTGVDMTGEARSELGLPPSRQEFRTLRARWAEMTNEALREANSEARIDHRSLEAQGIDREPRPRLPWGAIAAERRGERSEIAERIRERHRQRFTALREKTERKERGERAQKSADTPPADLVRADTVRVPPEPRPQTAGPQDMDARRQQAVRDWLKYRQGADRTGGGQGHERAAPLSMDEIRQRAVAAWRSLRARGAESQPSTERGRERDGRRDREEAEQTRDTPGLGDDFSG